MCITIDYLSQRIYWTDKKSGTYFRIESTDLDGNDRQVVYEGQYQRPSAIAVDTKSVFWTNVIADAYSLWHVSKSEKDKVPAMLATFSAKPVGLVTNTFEISSIPQCETLVRIVKENEDSSEGNFISEIDKNMDTVCLNNGKSTATGCKCGRGFTGVNCGSPMCYNFCIHGNCTLTNLGYTRCNCEPGYLGSRCERNICDDFCLNEGNCIYNPDNIFNPMCMCQQGFSGKRCEKNMNSSELCNMFCEGRLTDVLVDSSNTFICRYIFDMIDT